MEGVRMAINTRRRRSGPARDRSHTVEPFDPNPFVNHAPAPDVRTHVRAAEHTEWIYVPTIRFARPVDTVMLLGRDDDAASE
jgi:hypothetical protein